ncbi:BRO-N domain-containing protein [Oceaniglobus trochenteri]|uniref:BRO-N domain-containing protein n=1 Tax=Oceaniglobus trochenteri TaxID=2763260 RepID=UPI001CFFDC35|nr:BRO family protein [Oceaniglobus trochenteri]
MSADVIPFDFEEQAVRVVMRGDDPWFVAADVCRVLEIGNPSDAVSRLDNDERQKINLNTLDTIEGIRGNPNATIINESGLYALVLTSRKEQARRFRKWITAEVLPAIRRTGRYDHPGIDQPATGGGLDDSTSRDAELWLSMIREARLLGGTKAGRSMWARSPLPPLLLATAGQALTVSPAEGQACLDHLLNGLAHHLDGGFAHTDVALAPLGLRMVQSGLFVANAHPGILHLYRDTPWCDGRHRSALMALPGVEIHAGTLTIARQSVRGIVVPGMLLREVAA